MKRRSRQRRDHQEKRAAREKAMFRSRGESRYAQKRRRGQMYSAAQEAPEGREFCSEGFWS